MKHDEGPIDPPVSAKELAEMGFCEKRIELKHRLGLRQTKMQEARTAQGLREHRRYRAEGVAAIQSAGFGGKCFIASCVFGDSAWQTNVLRRYRDTFFLTRWWGRQMVRTYVCTAPIACVALRRWPVMQQPVRAFLNRFASALLDREEADREPL